MPIYDYKCSNPKCYNKFEVSCSMQEMKSVEHCPVCGSDSFRHFTAHPLMFKARGFPSNDNRKKSRGKQVVDSKVEDLFDDHKWKKKYGV